MIEILKFIEIAVAVCLVLIVLIQNKWTALNLNTMSWWMNEITRRWPEKVLHNITVVLWIIFIFNSASLFILR